MAVLKGGSSVAGDFNVGGNQYNSGDITANGDILGNRVFNAVWNDIAEHMPSDGSTQPGDLVKLDVAHHSFRVTKLNDYDPNIHHYIGIHSENPGFIVGQNNEYEYGIYVALKGMVYANIACVYNVGTRLYLTPNGIITHYDRMVNEIDIRNLIYLGLVIENKNRIKLFI